MHNLDRWSVCYICNLIYVYLFDVYRQSLVEKDNYKVSSAAARQEQ